MIAGVDGCKDKWIAVVDARDGRTEIWEPRPFLELYGSCALTFIVIDIPIGLSEKGPRQADVDARGLLGRRGVCVFPAPIRPILNCETWADACDKRTKIENKKISLQQFGILPKVREVDAALRRLTGAEVHEGHPEVSFARMNGESPLLIGKKKQTGKKLREELICKHFPDATSRLKEHPHHREDVLDAYALLWTARRIISGKAQWFPEQLVRDRFGLPMRIAA